MTGEQSAPHALTAAGRIDDDREDLRLDACETRENEALEAPAFREGRPLSEARRAREQALELVLVPAAMKGPGMEPRKERRILPGQFAQHDHSSVRRTHAMRLKPKL